jgi:hypothetical protein
MWCFGVRFWCRRKKLVGTHLKAPFEFRLIKMQEQNKDFFY